MCEPFFMQLFLSLIFIILIFLLLNFGLKKRKIKISNLEINSGNKDKNIPLKEYLKDIDEYFLSMRFHKTKINTQKTQFTPPPLLKNRGEKIEIINDALSLEIYGPDYTLRVLKGILESPGSTFEVGPDDKKIL